VIKVGIDQICIYSYLMFLLQKIAAQIVKCIKETFKQFLKNPELVCKIVEKAV